MKTIAVSEWVHEKLKQFCYPKESYEKMFIRNFKLSEPDKKLDIVPDKIVTSELDVKPIIPEKTIHPSSVKIDETWLGDPDETKL